MIALWCWLGLAAAAEYREVELADGRLLTAELLGMDGETIVVELPQGRASWPLTAIQDLRPATAEAYASQPAWTALVLPLAADAELTELAADAERRIQALLPRVPALEVWDRGALGERLGPAETEALAACGADAVCALEALGPLAPELVIGAELVSETAGEPPILRLASGFASAPLAARQVRVPYPAGEPGLDAQVMAGLYPLLHLDPDRFLLAELATYVVPGEPVAPPPPPEPPPQFRLAEARGLGWIPVPGLPSAVQGRPREAAVAAAVVLPGTAAMVYVAGWSTWHRRQLWLAGLGSYAVLSVAVNQLLLSRNTDRPARLGVAPLEGGAAVTATVQVP